MNQSYIPEGKISKISDLLQQNNAVIVSHFYTDASVQALTEATNGCIADSLGMAQFGAKHPAKTLIVCGVRFMGETAKILNPEKRILMPNREATCSLDIGCPAKEFSKFCQQHPDRTVVVYVNTSAEIKALADWTVTSSNALEIIDFLHKRGEKILWAPDRYLGSYIQKKTSADMLIWQSSCVIHEEFKADGIKKLKQLYPNAGILVHPESPEEVVAMADVVGSTSNLLQASKELPNEIFIVATDAGIIYKMQQSSPKKQFIPAPTMGNSSFCKSCAKCPWMQMNTLDSIEKSLITGHDEIFVDENIITKAKKPLLRMLNF